MKLTLTLATTKGTSRTLLASGQRTHNTTLSTRQAKATRRVSRPTRAFNSIGQTFVVSVLVTLRHCEKI